MTDKMDRMLTKIVNMSDEQKIHIGRRASKDLLRYLRNDDYSDDEIMDWIKDLSKLIICADHKVVQKEYEWFCNVTRMDLTDVEFFDAVKDGDNKSFVKRMLIRIQDLPDRTRKAMVMFCSALASSDDIINADEIDMLSKIEPNEDEDID